MTFKFPIPTATLTKYAEVGTIILALAFALFTAGRCAGRQEAKDNTDAAHDAALRDSIAVLAKGEEALERQLAQAESLSTHTGKPLVVAQLVTDTAARTELAARKALDAVLADSLAKLADVKAAARALAVSDSLAYAAVLAERDKANARIRSLVQDSTASAALLAKDAHLLDLSAQERQASAQVAKDLRPPSVVHRAGRGVVIAGAGASCAGLGLLASPLVAVGAFVVCSAVAGVAVP